MLFDLTIYIYNEKLLIITSITIKVFYNKPNIEFIY